MSKAKHAEPIERPRGCCRYRIVKVHQQNFPVDLGRCTLTAPVTVAPFSEVSLTRGKPKYNCSCRTEHTHERRLKYAPEPVQLPAELVCRRSSFDMLLQIHSANIEAPQIHCVSRTLSQHRYRSIGPKNHQALYT